MTEPRQVTLHIDSDDPKVTPINGLALWTVMNELNIEKKDEFAIREGEDVQKLNHIQFKFERKLDWADFRHTCIPRLKHSASLGIPHLPELLPHSGKMAIVGAGPSVIRFVDEIKKYRDNDLDNIMTVNGAHDWLIQHGVVPRIHVISEIDCGDVTVHLGGQPNKDVTYYISSSCDENISRQLSDYKRVLFHPFMPMQGYQQAINRYFKNEFMVASGWATFFKSLAIATVLGFRNINLYGIDSSFEDSSHVKDYTMADKEPRITIWAGDEWGQKVKKFTTQGGLAYQAKEFLEFCKYNQSGLKLQVRGDGLLRYLHQSRYPEQYVHERKGL